MGVKGEEKRSGSSFRRPGSRKFPVGAPSAVGRFAVICWDGGGPQCRYGTHFPLALTENRERGRTDSTTCKPQTRQRQELDKRPNTKTRHEIRTSRGSRRKRALFQAQPLSPHPPHVQEAVGFGLGVWPPQQAPRRAWRPQKATSGQTWNRPVRSEGTEDPHSGNPRAPRAVGGSSPLGISRWDAALSRLACDCDAAECSLQAELAETGHIHRQMSYRGPTNSLASIGLSQFGHAGHRRSSGMHCIFVRPLTCCQPVGKGQRTRETEMAIRMDGE